MAVTTEQLAAFAAAVDEKRLDYFAAQGYKTAIEVHVPTEVQQGRTYARIVTRERGTPHGMGSAFCFVRLADGAIMKAAGWKAPAKGNRGNIANGAADVTAYGAVYR